MSVCRQHKVLRALSRAGHPDHIRLALHKDFLPLFSADCVCHLPPLITVWCLGAQQNRDKSSDCVVRCKWLLSAAYKRSMLQDHFVKTCMIKVVRQGMWDGHEVGK